MTDSSEPAFPFEYDKNGNSPSKMPERVFNSGLTMRDYFAAHAPIDYVTAKITYGGDLPITDAGRCGFFAVWTMLRYEYADAMLAARSADDASAP